MKLKGLVMKTYVTSDLHFGHANIKKFCPITRARFSDDTDHMNEVMIKEWNDIVEEKDVVYILGDVAFMQAEKAADAVSKAEAEKHQKAIREFVSGQRSGSSLGSIGSESPMKVIKRPYKAGGKVKAPSASKRADGIAQRGKTRGRMI
jgi:hypothetical protein